MTPHLDILGRLHQLWGLFGLLTGSSLVILAAGTNAALDDLGLEGAAGPAAVGILAFLGGLIAAVGLAAIVVGVALGRRRPFGRMSALLLAIPHLVIAPFGTALGVYAFWVLLHDDARRAFGRPGGPARLVSPLDRP